MMNMQILNPTHNKPQVTRIINDQQMGSVLERLRHLAAGNAVVIFVISGCCMCHVVKQLLLGLGVGPTVVELDRHGEAGLEMHAVLRRLSGDGQQTVPAVFVGGKFLGGIEAVMTCHINGTLVPLLKEAGGLWL
ncbi:glutaredoxin-C9-like [Impatiens glandulifera]|uniref:glutaredoxin-C9-like n=1 Tax=Impatiens glandulifera TaxID=253017 RepID=UPI001FB1595E|nr:glutaredoxin-C9-like [Impatiens glandulifera]